MAKKKSKIVSKKKASRKKSTKTASRRAKKDSERFWLMFSAKLVSRPIIYELGKKFQVVTNIRQASVHDEVGLVSLEVSGDRNEIDKAIKWLERIGVKVEPVEINVIAG